MEIKTAGCPLGAKCEEVKEKDGVQILYRCPWYIQIRGTDKNTGAEVDHWGCAISWLPALLMDTTAAARSGAAATESFRNEMVNHNGATQDLMLNMVRLTVEGQQQPKLLEGER